MGIFRPANMFMAAPVFLELGTLKKVAGYGPHDIGAVNINIKNPRKRAIPLSNRLHDAMKPGIAVIGGALKKGKRESGAYVFGFRNDSASHVLLAKAAAGAAGDTARAYGKEGVIMSAGLARLLGVSVGDTCTFRYTGKYDAAEMSRTFAVSGIAAAFPKLPENSLLVNEREFFRAFYDPWPKPVGAEVMKTLPAADDPAAAFLAPEYILCKRSTSTEEMADLYREIGKSKFKGAMVDIESMYESASAILKIEQVLNIITRSAGLVLFFIILVGVVNTLRMTIRERTREIGTVRAIGMQKVDVRRSFLIETGFLALFASVAGALLAFAAMWGLSQITFNTQDNPFGMLLVRSHLFFAPTAIGTLGYIILIVGIAVAAAYFPARRASNISAANAMRHYE